MSERDDRREGRSTGAANPQRFPARLTGAILVLVGFAHLLVPGVLLRTARIGYRYVLRVEFDPKPGASGRVRGLGLAMIAAGAHLLYHGGIVPRGARE
jgi:hypothetical protein